MSSAARGILYLVRGLPGSGRSTLARELAGVGGVVVCPEMEVNDGCFPRFGRDFNALCLNQAMAKLQDAFRENTSPVVLDRPHIRIWEMHRPVGAALEAGYRVEIRRTSTPWAEDPDACHRLTQHRVARRLLREMARHFETDVAPEFVLHMPRPTQRMAHARMLVRSVADLPPDERRVAEQELFAEYVNEYMELLAEGYVQRYAPAFIHAARSRGGLDLDAPLRDER